MAEITVTKELLGREDNQLQDSATRTFTRPTSTGGTQTLTKINLAPENTFNLKDFGAVGDGVTDDDTAVQAWVAAGIAAGGTLYADEGTYLISSPIDLSGTAGNHVNIVGIGEAIFLKSTLTSPILLPAQGARYENFTIRFSTRPGVSDLRAVGIQLGGGVDRDDATAIVSNSSFKNINIYQTFVGILCGPIVEAGEAASLKGNTFANSWSDILIRDFYQSAIVQDMPSGNNTGESWVNLQIKNKQWDSATQVNGAGSVLYLRNWLVSAFNMTHIDNIGDEDTPASAPKPILNMGITSGAATSVAVFNGLHIENCYFSTADQSVFELNENCGLLINGLNWNGNTVAAGSGNFINLVGFKDSYGHASINGFTVQGNGTTTGTFRQSANTSGGSRAGCSMYVTGFVTTDADASVLTVNTAAESASDGKPFLKQWNDKIYYQETEGQGLFAAFPHGEKTIATGVITLDGDEMAATVDTESDAATDDLDGINETPTPVDGQILILRSANSNRDVTVRNTITTSGADRFDLNGGMPCVLSSTSDRLIVQYEADNGRWVELGRRTQPTYARLQFANNSALAVSTTTIAPTGSRHRIDNSAGTATIDTITVPHSSSQDEGMVLVLSNTTTGNTVTYDQTGNILLTGGTTFAADSENDTLMLMYDETLAKWLQIGGGNNT